MSYRFLIVNTDYGHFLEQMYRRNPGLSTKSFNEQYSARMQTLFGVNDFYSANLSKLGSQAIDLIYNNRYMQYAFAVEHGLMKTTNNSNEFISSLSDEWLAAVFKARVKIFNPDVIVNLAMETVTSEILNAVKSDVKLIIGQHAAPLTNTVNDLSAYDLLVSSIPCYVDYFREKGKESKYFKLGFESTILETVPAKKDRPVDIAFVGGFSTHHSGGAELFNYLAEEGFSMTLYGYGQESLSPQARSFFQGGTYGMDMYELYSGTKIVINRHIDISGEYANNMRLYEAAGMGALLITDWKKNLGELFDVGNEVVAYRSKEECAELVRYYLKNNGERQRIAADGQKRILAEHTYYHRMAELVKIVDNHLATHDRETPRFVNAVDLEPPLIEISEATFQKDLQELKIAAEKKRFGRHKVKVLEYNITVSDLMSLYMELKDIFGHQIYSFNPQSSNPIIIDAGAYVGLATLYWKRRFPNARVMGFEPDPEIFKLLEKNVRENGLQDVSLVNAALYDEECELPFMPDGSDGGVVDASDGQLKVKGVRLSKYINQPIDFLKMNIEGCEWRVLNEIADKLELVKELVIEYHGFPQLGQSLHKILELLARKGFRYFINDFDMETNSATKPPFCIDEKKRFFLLIYARNLGWQVEGVEKHSPNSESIKPVSRIFGLDRGQPIDRYYIEKFLAESKRLIQGRVLEVGDNGYTLKYGEECVTQSDILHYTADNPKATVIGDLATGAGLPESTFDCFILTQTLPFIFDVKEVVKNAVKVLKPGGVLLATVPGISQISRYDMVRWGDYWRFTTASVRKLFSGLVPAENLSIEFYGNVRTAKAFMDGLASHELSEDELEYKDPDYQLMITIRATKPERTPQDYPVEQTFYNANTTRGSRANILLYHRVMDVESDPQLLCVTPENFTEHIRIIREYADIISLRELGEKLRCGKLPERAVVITFDDGYADNLYNAKRILEVANTPATVFVCSGYVGKKCEFWWDELERIFLLGHQLPASLTMNADGKQVSWPLGTMEQRRVAYDALHPMIRALESNNLRKTISELLLWAGLPENGRDDFRCTTPEEVRQLAASGLVEIGAHTKSHCMLSAQHPEVQWQEIWESKQQLEAILGQPVKSFSYPFGGKSDVNETTIEFVQDAGFDLAVANVPSNIHARSNPYWLPRHLVRNWDAQTFREKLSEFLGEHSSKGGHRGQRKKVSSSCVNKTREKLSVLYVNTHDSSGGTAKVTQMLKNGLKKRGYQTKMLVGDKQSSDPDVSVIKDALQDTGEHHKKQGYLDYDINSTFTLNSRKEFRESDIVHFHNLHGDYFNPFALSDLTKMKPSVWTLHDMQALTGHCAHSFDCTKWKTGCGNCPNLEIYPKVLKDNTGRMWADKKKIYSSSDITLVVPSLWLKHKVEESILKDKRVQLVYNGIDTNIFHPYPKKAVREQLGLPQEAVILAFSAHGGMDSIWRDGKCLAETIEYLSQKHKSILFLNIGSPGNSYGARNTINIPHITDEEMLAKVYSAADLFLFPSLADNCPLTVIESMACGLPVITYETGGVPEIVQDGQTGVIVGYKKKEEFIKAVEGLILKQDKRREYSQAGMQRAKEIFSLDVMLNKYLILYQELVEAWKKRSYILPKNRIVAHEKIQQKEYKYLVSAIVSTYNSEKYIRGCLEDLEKQTIADKLEIIVVNSGSQQNEEAIVKEFQQTYDNIVYIKTEHREGIYAAWNRAVKAARGKFITNANTDDRHRKDALEIMSRTLQANPDIALVYGDQICTDTPNGTFTNHHAIEMARRAEYSHERLLFGCCVGSQPMWRKSLHAELGYFDDTLICAGDWDFWLRISISSRYKFKHIPEFLGLYYYNENGIEHGRKIHSLYERYIVGKRYGNPYISVIPLYTSKDNPLVSVIMPAYNAADYIAEAIESVLIQNYRNFELIVIDDGSTDNTKDIVTNFRDDKIKYFYKNNGGPSGARNLAINKSKGQYIMPLDADDMMTPDFIAKHLAEFEKHPEVDLVYCDVLLIDENSNPVRIMNKPEYQDRRHLIRDLLRAGHPVVPFRLGIKRTVFDKIGYYDEDLLIGEDYDMMRRFVKAGLKAHHLSETLHLRRMHADSLSRNYSAQKAKCHFDVIKRYIDTFTYDELFPDVAWNKIAPQMRQLHAKCLAAGTYLAIGQEYVKTNATEFSRTAFDRACSELNDCLKMDPKNQQIQQLLQKCEFGKQKYDEQIQQAVC